MSSNSMIQLPASTSTSPSPAPSAEVPPLSKHRKRVHSARKKMERVAHERAPGLSTMVAGHNYTYTFLNNVAGAGKAKNNKRYSASEYQHLVPDELGELHDPEYESIKIVTRKPSISTIGDAASDSEESSDLDESESEASSSRSGPMPGLGRSHPSYRYVPSYERYRNTSLNATSFGAQQPKTLQGFTTSLSAHHHSSSSSRSQRSRDSSFNPSISNSSYTSNANGSFASSRLSASHQRPESTFTGDSGGKKSTRTYADGGVTYLAPSVTMPPTSLLSSSARTTSTGTGGTIGGGTGGTYNPYTYVPTTAATSNSNSSRLAPPRKYPMYGSSATSSQSRAFGVQPQQQRSSSASSTHATKDDIYAHAPPSTAPNPNLPAQSNVISRQYNPPPTIRLNSEEIIETAPPIAWSSTFTPSSEHPERHRTKHQTSSVKVDDALQVGKAGLQRSYQKLKLDVSFGLLKLKK